jgi:hypothetical protein
MSKQKVEEMAELKGFPYTINLSNGSHKVIETEEELIPFIRALLEAGMTFSVHTS